MHVQLGVGATGHVPVIRECNGKLNRVKQEALESGISEPMEGKTTWSSWNKLSSRFEQHKKESLMSSLE